MNERRGKFLGYFKGADFVIVKVFRSFYNFLIVGRGLVVNKKIKKFGDVTSLKIVFHACEKLRFLFWGVWKVLWTELRDIALYNDEESRIPNIMD